jgi:hypothetical protein
LYTAGAGLMVVLGLVNDHVVVVVVVVVTVVVV